MSDTASPEAKHLQSLDYFEMLGLPRHPWVDPVILKANYHSAASQRHPDQAGGSQDRFIRLGEAVTCLRETHSRLRHLIDLEFPGDTKGITARPDTELFQSVASSLESARLIQQEIRRATTNLSRTSSVAKLLKCIPVLEKQLAVVKSKRAEQDQLCRTAGPQWALLGAVFWKEETSRARYYAKWQRELEDTLFTCRNEQTIEK